LYGNVQLTDVLASIYLLKHSKMTGMLLRIKASKFTIGNYSNPN